MTATGGTLTLATGISGAGTLAITPGATASLAGAPANNTVGMLTQNGTLATAGKNVTVSKAYTNANFGTGNGFNKNANVTGGGQILASGSTAQAITGANVVNGTTAAPTLALGQFHTSDGRIRRGRLGHVQHRQHGDGWPVVARGDPEHGYHERQPERQ